MYNLVDKLEKNHILTKEEFVSLINNYQDEKLRKYLFDKAVSIRKKHYGEDIYLRGLIEFTNYCSNDCYYCGIRKSNLDADRYRLSEEEILECCQIGYDLGYRTFVLQGGEDNFFTREKMVSIIKNIKTNYPDCALTISVGEKDEATYQAYYDAGADRYLLRHESANDKHYSLLHPEELTLKNRKDCLFKLKEIGFQVGCGFMVGSPYQSVDSLAEDLIFIHELQPHMIGIGPFIAHEKTMFKDYESGSVELTTFMLALVRLIIPKALIPSTTALGTIDNKGREAGILAGANVVMPNLSPISVREKYMLYDNKICTGDEAAECRNCLGNRMESIGYHIVVDRGDYDKKKPIE